MNQTDNNIQFNCNNHIDLYKTICKSLKRKRESDVITHDIKVLEKFQHNLMTDLSDYSVKKSR